MTIKHLTPIFIIVFSLVNCSPPHPGVELPLPQQEVSPPLMSSGLSTLPTGVSIHQLDNGLQVLLIENPGLPMVGINVQVQVGSAYETFATSGMSHMLEHLLFNGTERRTQKELYDDVDFIGGYNNAHTSTYYTNYMMVTPAENIDQGMDIQADMLFHSILPEEKFAKEKGIVLEEIAQSLTSPANQIEKIQGSLLFPGHALSLPTLGTYATIEGMSRDDVYDFYNNAYVPNNMIVTAIGNFQRDSMLTMLQETYGKASPNEVIRKHPAGWAVGYESPDINQKTWGQIYHRSYDGDKIQVHLFYPLGPSKTLSTPFISLLEKALSGPVSELELQLKEQFSDEVESLSMTLLTQPIPNGNYVKFTLTVSDVQSLDDILTSISSYLHNLDPGLSRDVVLAEATAARTHFLKNLEKPHMFGIYYAGHLATDDIETVFSNIEQNNFLSAAEQLDRWRFTQTGPTSVIVYHPDEDTSTEQTVKSVDIREYPGSATKPTLIVKQNPNSNLLAVHYLIQHKARLESTWGKEAARILHNCLEQRLTSPERQAESRAYGFSYTLNDNPYIPMDNIYLHPDFGYMRIEGLADDIPGAVSFLHRVMLNFTPTREEFENARNRFKHLAHPMGGEKARDLFDETVDDIIYETEQYPEGPDPFSYDSLPSFTGEYFQPGNMIISVVSPEEPKTIQNLMQRFQGTGTGIDLEESAYERAYKLPSESVTVEKTAGGEQTFLFWGFMHTIDPEDAPVLQALSLILSDKIVFTVREKQGMAYRMRAGINVNDDVALCYVRLGTRPQNADQLINQFPGFFTPDMLSDVTEEDLQKSINMYLGRMMFRRLSSINQAYYLGYSKYFHDDIQYDQEFLDQLKQVHLEDVRAAAEQYLQISNPVSIVVK